MKIYLLKRLVLIIPTFIGITLLTYLLVRNAPGDFTTLKMGMQGGIRAGGMSSEIIEQERKLYGLDRAWYIGYGVWLFNFMQGDLGVSRKDRRPVIESIKDALPITLILNFATIFLMYIISIPIGIISSVKKDSSFDKISGIILFILYSLPHFWIGLLLLTFLSGGEYLDLFPLTGISSEYAQSAGFFTRFFDTAWHLVLPVITLTYGSLAFLSRYTRANMLEVINQQYITTARAKGLSEKKVIFVHAFRNSLIPLITLMATLLPGLLGGSVIVETIFSIPGMGKLSFDAVLSRNLPVIMAVTSLTAILTLIGILIADIMYAVVDPRIRLESRV